MNPLWNDAIEGRRDFTITTYTGRIINVLDPRPEDICIEDIAQGLSLLCRYAGQLRDFYSVAEHSVACAHAAKGAHGIELARAALLHDAAEAYVGDVIGPVKGAMRKLGGEHFDILERRFAQAIAIHFGLAPNVDLEFADLVFEAPAVKAIDKRACAQEQIRLRQMPRGWKVGVEPLPFEPECWPPYVAKIRFMAAAHELGLAGEAEDPLRTRTRLHAREHGHFGEGSSSVPRLPEALPVSAEKDRRKIGFMKCPCCVKQLPPVPFRVACCWCGAPLTRVGDRFELAGVPPIESKAEIATRQAAVSRFVGGAP